MADHIIFAATFAGIFFIAGSGLLVLTGSARYASVAQGGYLILGAGLTCVFSRNAHPDGNVLAGLGLPFYQAALLAAAITAVVSLILGLATIQLRSSEALAGSFIIVFVVRWFVEQYQLLDGDIIQDSQIKVSVGSLDFTRLVIGDHHFSQEGGMLILVSCVALMFFLFVYNIKRSTLSLNMRAAGENETVPKTNAISPPRVVAAGHLIAGFSAGTAGALFLYALNVFRQLYFASANNMWVIIFGFALLVIVYLAENKRVFVSAAIMLLVSGVFFFFVHYLDEYLEFAYVLRHRFTSENIFIIVVGLVGLVVIHSRSWIAKNKL